MGDKREYRIMFVCHGNICRSPMAEFIMKGLAREAGLEDRLCIASSATSREEIGCGLYPPAARVLALHGVEARGHRARQFTIDDYNSSDIVVVMEDYNIRNLLRIIGCDCDTKVWKLLDFVVPQSVRWMGEDISDPWYHDNFEKTYNEILTGCKALIEYLKLK